MLEGTHGTFQSTNSLYDFTATVQSTWPNTQKKKIYRNNNKNKKRVVPGSSLCSVCFLFCPSEKEKKNKKFFGFNRIAFSVLLYGLDELAGRIGMQAPFALSSATNRTESSPHTESQNQRGRRPDE